MKVENKRQNKNKRNNNTFITANKDLILNPYNELELESLKTKSAITYKKTNLDLDDKTIIFHIS